MLNNKKHRNPTKKHNKKHRNPTKKHRNPTKKHRNPTKKHIKGGVGIGRWVGIPNPYQPTGFGWISNSNAY